MNEEFYENSEFVFKRDCGWHKLVGMLAITGSVFLLVIAQLDSSIEALVAGLLIMPAGVILARLDEKITVSIIDRAIFIEKFSGEWNLPFLNQTILFEEIKCLTAKIKFNKRDEASASIYFLSSGRNLYFTGGDVNSCRETFVRLLKETKIPAGPNPWNIESIPLDKSKPDSEKKLLLHSLGSGSSNEIKHLKDKDGALIPVPVECDAGISRFNFATRFRKPWDNQKINRNPAFFDAIVILIFAYIFPPLAILALLKMLFSYIERERNSARWIDQIEIDSEKIRFKSGLEGACDWREFSLRSLVSVYLQDKKSPCRMKDFTMTCLEFCLDGEDGKKVFVSSGWGWAPETLQACCEVIESLQRDPYLRDPENPVKLLCRDTKDF